MKKKDDTQEVVVPYEYMQDLIHRIGVAEKRTKDNGKLIIWLCVLTSLFGLFVWITIAESDLIRERIYPDGNTQKLATECDVNNILKAPKKVEEYTGYWFDEAGNKRNVNILDEHEGFVKIEAEPQVYIRMYGLPTIYNQEIKWIPKKDYHLYYKSLKELSEEVNKLKEKR